MCFYGCVLRRIVFLFDSCWLCAMLVLSMNPILTLITGELAMREWIAEIRKVRNSCRRRRLICEYLGHPDAQLYAQISQSLDDILFKYSAYAYN